MKQGNGLALAQLYDLYVDALFGYGRKFTKQPEIIEDAVQDILAELWSKRDKLCVPDSVKAYLFKAFRQKLLRQLSSSRRLSLIEVYPPMADDTDREQPSGTGEFSGVDLEFKAKLKKALASLSPREQEAITLRYTENLTCDEIAEVMEIKKQTLYNLLHSAIRKLAKALKGEPHPSYLYLFFNLVLWPWPFITLLEPILSDPPCLP